METGLFGQYNKLFKLQLKPEASVYRNSHAGGTCKAQLLRRGQ